MKPNCLYLPAIICASALCLLKSEAKENRPNIVFVMIDDLGAEQISAYGSESYSTPNIDKLAEKGMLFENAFSQPMCQISRATLMTGQYGFRTGFPNNNDRDINSENGWAKGVPTVASLLQDAGYTTAISGKWHLADFSRHPDHLTRSGFEFQNVWAGLLGKERTRRYWESTYFREKELVTDKPGIYGPDEFCGYVTDFMAKHKDDENPFFIYYPMVLVHFPFPQTPNNIDEPQLGWTSEDNLRIAEEKKWSKMNYESMVTYADKLIGQVVRQIEDLRIEENTLLIVTSDNGSYHGTRTKYKGQLIEGQKGKVTDGGIRVPFIAYWKGIIKPGSVNEKLVDFSDVLPTLVELGGGELPADRRLDGMSFLGQIMGDNKAASRQWVFAGNSPVGMIRADKFSLDSAGQLYDLQKDRYQPELLKKGTYTEIHQTYYKMLSSAMEGLDQPFRKGLNSKKKRVKKSAGKPKENAK